jgi:hypothetical protein
MELGLLDSITGKIPNSDYFNLFEPELTNKINEIKNKNNEEK